VFSVYVRAAGPDPREPELTMHSQITDSAVASLVDRDTILAEVGMPFTIPASRWKSDYVYSSVTEIIRRIGKERWTGRFRMHDMAVAGTDATASETSPDVELLRLE
jgi:hypothetical protein